MQYSKYLDFRNKAATLDRIMALVNGENPNPNSYDSDIYEYGMHKGWEQLADQIIDIEKGGE